MDPQLSNIEKIIMYLDDDFKPEEINDFEEQLFFDNSLVEDFLLIKEIEENLKETNFDEFSQSLRRVHYAFKEYEYANNLVDNSKLMIPLRNRCYRSLYKAAAVLILLIGITFILYNISTNKIQNTENIFAKYYTTYQLNGQYRSVGERVKYFEKAFDAYSKKDYRLATDYFDKINELDNAVLFYKGISLIECNELLPAIKCFETGLKNSNNMFISQMHWYLALTFLKMNQPAKAKTHLSWLVQNIQYNNYYGSQAIEILADLNKK